MNFTSITKKNLFFCTVDLQGCMHLRCTTGWFHYTCSFSCSFPLWFTLDTEHSFLCYTPGPCCLSTEYIMACACWPKTPKLTTPFTFGNHKFVFHICESVSVWKFLCHKGDYEKQRVWGIPPPRFPICVPHTGQLPRLLQHTLLDCSSGHQNALGTCFKMQTPQGLPMQGSRVSFLVGN